MGKAANTLTNTILHYLRLRGIWAWKNQTGAYKPEDAGGRSRFIRFGALGSGDIFAVLPPDGRFCSIEVKTGKDELRESQIDWIGEVEAAGGLSVVARSVDDVIAALQKLPAADTAHQHGILFRNGTTTYVIGPGAMTPVELIKPVDIIGT